MAECLGIPLTEINRVPSSSVSRTNAEVVVKTGGSLVFGWREESQGAAGAWQNRPSRCSTTSAPPPPVVVYTSTMAQVLPHQYYYYKVYQQLFSSFKSPSFRQNTLAWHATLHLLAQCSSLIKKKIQGALVTCYNLSSI